MSIFFAQFTDAHAHLPSSEEHDSKLCIPANSKILLNSTCGEDFARVATLAKRFPQNIVPAFGVHPWHAERWTSETEKLLRTYLSCTKNAVIGEIGLDAFRENLAQQEFIFIKQLSIATEFRIPTSIHCVRSFGKVEKILRVFFNAGTLSSFLMHAYSGSPEQAKLFSKFGGVFSTPKKTLPSECIIVPESDRPLA